MSLTKIGRYQILGELGRGAMGVVYRALDPNIGREVAIKTIHLDLQEAEAVERFRREAKAAGNLTHPNIVTIYDAGEDNGIFYIAMELLSGETLGQMLAKRSMALVEMISILEQIAAGLDYAHGRHVVHRDIKPGNIMIADGHVKVMDFGLAKITSTMASASNRVVGTPSYMSPEQITSGTIDGRSDIFSIGAMLYEMLAGVRPFRGDNIAVVMYKIMREDPEPLATVNPSLPESLNAVVLKALAKEPAQRYRNCGELIEDLRACAGMPGKESAIASRASGGTLPGRSQPEAPSEALVRTVASGAPRGADAVPGQAKPSRASWKSAAAAVAGFVVLLIAGLAYWQARPGSGTDGGGESDVVAPAPPEQQAQPPAAGSGSAPGGRSIEAVPATPAPAAQPSPPAPASPRPQTQQTQPPAAATPPAPPTPLPPAVRGPATPSAAAGAVGRVSLHTEPQGARIFVNDEETSYRTPVNFGLAAGTYQIRVERPGYASQTRQIVVRQNETVTERIELQRNGEGRSLNPFR